ncbi:hypothetical protein GKC39_18450 [Bacillus velezensis]|uniref:Uncharacterized protein n=1 Tax=Bacillus velezensis TaxID=492670 RepID=A0A6A8LJU1_BACVE|nr:hypothetical protein [Bacillus velezensis]MSE04024.1 hypothetical protein [Bacillus velezensis]
MIRVYQKGDSQYNNLTAAWSKMTRYEKEKYQVETIILAPSQQRENVDLITKALNGDEVERFTSIVPCLMVCVLEKKAQI